ncbi:hypothetical protein QDD76_006385 [Burkholderia cepacia]|nr:MULTISPECIES: hypothetical protein [Burkholderia]EKS9799948.1 hypothetical protein [Burkholderia cepacia]EKS9807353.1 hypothetical protein [Burkholderia cepacia]EKS9814866.1 hypothetical protein [Burkholderia cepacia]EKS9822367.1 hypothetical protein [Burkholderia cepacia]EKS9830165.1 hypothetical protein [Burkholderia cepacia]
MIVIVTGKYGGGFVTFAIDARCTAVFARRRTRCQRRVVRQIDTAHDREGRALPESRALSGHAHARDRDRTRAARGRFPRLHLTHPAATADPIAPLRALAFSSGETHAPPVTRSADRPPRR